MKISLDIPDEFVPGLTIKLDKHNQDKGASLTLDEFISYLLGQWARHAVTKDRMSRSNEVTKLVSGLSTDQLNEIKAAYGPGNKP